MQTIEIIPPARPTPTSLETLIERGLATIEVWDAYPIILRALHVKGREAELKDFLEQFSEANTATEQLRVVGAWNNR